MLISEVSKITGLSPYTIRYYEKEGLVSKGNRKNNNYRHFNEEAIYNLQFVHFARNLGFSLKEIKDFIRIFKIRRNHNEITKRLESKLIELNQKIQELQKVKKAVANLLMNCKLDPHSEKLEFKDLIESIKKRK